MQPQAFVVSNPPHPQVDHEAVAATLGLAMEDARLKVGFSAPEVLTATDPAPAGEFAASLQAAGLNVTVLEGASLAAVPWPEARRQIMRSRNGADTD